MIVVKLIEIQEDVVRPPVLDHFRLHCGEEIPAILIGEEGRGRRLGVLPVALPQALYKAWEDGQEIRIEKAQMSQTRSGHPKLVWRREQDIKPLKALLVFRTPIGYRGWNLHEFPPDWEILVEGIIAQGEAGRMGRGKQYIVLATPGVATVRIEGRRYGKPGIYRYELLPDLTLRVITGEEFEILGDLSPSDFCLTS